MSGILNSYTICVFSQILQIGIFAPKRREILICKIIVIKLRYKLSKYFFSFFFIINWQTIRFIERKNTAIFMDVRATYINSSECLHFIYAKIKQDMKILLILFVILLLGFAQRK